MTSEDWNPGKLLETSGAYWQTCTLHAGVKLDLFTDLGGLSLSARDLAQSKGADHRAMAMLLDALAAMGLIHKSGKRYANTPAALTYLSRESDKYIGHMILHHHHLVASWSRLDRAVETGRPVRTRSVTGDAERRESFLMGMFNNAMLLAPLIIAHVDLSGRRRLLDLGGGPGTYAIHFCMQHPALSATVVDLPTTRPFAEATIGRFSMDQRIDFADGDYHQDRIPGRYDVAWLSHILHAEGPEGCRRILAKAVAALEPGGLLLVHDFVLDDTRDSPLFPALFSLNMLLGTESGQAYSEGQIRKMMETAGVGNVRRLSFRGPTDSAILAGEA